MKIISLIHNKYCNLFHFCENLAVSLLITVIYYDQWITTVHQGRRKYVKLPIYFIFYVMICDSSTFYGLYIVHCRMSAPHSCSISHQRPLFLHRSCLLIRRMETMSSSFYYNRPSESWTVYVAQRCWQNANVI